MTCVASFADIDVASGKFQRRIEPHVLHASTVSSIVKRGATSTSLPTLAAATIASMKPADRSSFLWGVSVMCLLRGQRNCACVFADGQVIARWGRRGFGVRTVIQTL